MGNKAKSFDSHREAFESSGKKTTLAKTSDLLT